MSIGDIAMSSIKHIVSPNHLARPNCLERRGSLRSFPSNTHIHNDGRVASIGPSSRNNRKQHVVGTSRAIQERTILLPDLGAVDEIDLDAQVLLDMELVLVIPFEGRGVEHNEPGHNSFVN